MAIGFNKQYELPDLKVGDISGGNYLLIEDDGTKISKGDATAFDDMLNNASSFTVEGDRRPTIKYFLNDGGVGTDNARSFNGTSDYGTIAQADMANWENTGHISLNVWMKPDDLEGEILFLDGMLDFYFSGGALQCDFDDVGNISTTTTLSQNAWSMITLTLEDTGSRCNMCIYINGNKESERSRNGNLQAVGGDGIIARWTSGWYNKSIYDELVIVNKTFSQANVTAMYNAGTPESLTAAKWLTYGNTEQGAAIVEATDVLAYYEFNEVYGTNTIDNNSTLGAGHDIILNSNDISVVSGIVGNAGSKGIALPHWSHEVINEVHINAQTPHKRKTATDYLQHIHAAKTEVDTGWICVALEYMALSIGQTPTTTTIVRSYIKKFGGEGLFEHCLAEMDSTVDGSNLGISSTFVGRLYRDTEWEDANDGQQVADYITGSGTVLFTKYNHDVIFFASDAHVEIDSDGSREEYSK